MQTAARHMLKTVIHVVLIITGVTSSYATDSGGLSPADLAAVKGAVQAEVKAVHARDWAGYAKLYTQDAIINPPNAPLVKGRAEIQAMFEALPPITHFTLDVVQVEGRGDLAYAYCAYRMTIVLPDTPEPIQDWGKSIAIRRRQPDGKWLISLDIFNSDVPAGP